MDPKTKAIIVGLLLGVVLVVLAVSLSAAFMFNGDLRLWIPEIPAVGLSAFLAGWYFRRLSDKQPLLWQFLIPFVTVLILGFLTIAIRYAVVKMADPLHEPAIYPLESLLQIPIVAAIIGLFFGVAGYRFKDTKKGTIRAGIVAMLLVFVLYAVLSSMYSALFFPNQTIDVLFWFALQLLSSSVLTAILFGVVFAALYRPFTELLRGNFFANLHVYSFLLSVFCLISLILTATLSPSSTPMWLFALLVTLALLAYLVINAKRLIHPLFTSNLRLSYGAALMTIFVIPAAVNLFRLSLFGLGGLFTVYLWVFLLPGMLLIPAVFAFPYIMFALTGDKPLATASDISYGLVGVRVSRAKPQEQKKPKKAK